MQIDSTPLDVAVLLDDGLVGRVELTGLIDVATRTVTAAVLRPSTKAVNASLLSARTVTPEPMRPGRPEALRMANSVPPYRRMLELDERLERAAARPVIIPETIVRDQEKVFVSNAFRATCRMLGDDLQPAHDASPAEKPHTEKMMFSVGTLFAQYNATLAIPATSTPCADSNTSAPAARPPPSRCPDARSAPGACPRHRRSHVP